MLYARKTSSCFRWRGRGAVRLRDTRFQCAAFAPTRWEAQRPEWLHKVKYDGYHLIVIREDKRVRLITRNAHGPAASSDRPLRNVVFTRPRPKADLVFGRELLRPNQTYATSDSRMSAAQTNT